MLTEKIVARASLRYAIVVDESKLVARLAAKFPTPVELVRDARVTAMRALEALGGKPVLRMAKMKDGPVITDHGNLVLDVTFPRPFDPVDMEARIALIPGVTASGIFTVPVTDLFVGAADGAVRHQTAAAGGPRNG